MIIAIFVILFISTSVVVMYFSNDFGNPFELFKKVPKKLNEKVYGTRRDIVTQKIHDTLKNKNYTLEIIGDEVYFRLNGDENKGEAYSDVPVKIYQIN